MEYLLTNVYLTVRSVPVFLSPDVGVDGVPIRARRQLIDES
jgi:hypothetical protein